MFTLFAILFTLLGVAMAGLGHRRRVRRPHLPAGPRPAALPRAPRLRPAAPESRRDRRESERRRVGGGVAVTRIAVFAYSDTGHACLKSLLDRGENVVLVATHADDPRRRPGSRASRSSRASRGIEPVVMEDPPTPAVDRARAGRAARLALLLLLTATCCPRRSSRSAAPGRLQHARLAAAEVPRPRAGELGRLEGRRRRARRST